MSEHRIDVGKVLDDAPLTAYHWPIVLFGALMMMLDGYDPSVMGIALPAVSEAWKVDPSLFKWSLSASLVGVGVGSVISGFMGDKLGRKRTLMMMYVLGSLACLGTVTATSVPQLVAWRFLVGVGMGGAIPNVIALISELMPAKRRPLMVVLVYSGAALGGALGSLLASVIIPAFGWTSVFFVGGLLPLVIAVLVWKAVPESPAFLITKGRLHPQASATVMRLRPGFPSADAQRLSVVGASFCMGALAASCYPTAIRATGVGMGLGIGRVGSIASPILAGSALAAGWSNTQIFTAATVPAAVAGVAVLVLSVIGQRQRHGGGDIAR